MTQRAILLYEKWNKADLEKFDVVSRDENGDMWIRTMVLEVGPEITAKGGQKQKQPKSWATGVIVEWDPVKDGDLSVIIDAAADDYNKKHGGILDKSKLYI